MARGTKHGKGKGKWRVERRKVNGKWYWNYRERYIRKGGKRRYRPGGKGRGPR